MGLSNKSALGLFIACVAAKLTEFEVSFND